jgi:hypothetical protein
MSLFDTLRLVLPSISTGHPTPYNPNTTREQLLPTIDLAYSVIDEALLDPILRIAAEQQAVRRDQEKIREILRSPERIAAFEEREKEILVRLGADRAWCEAFFRDLDLVKNFPAELLETHAPDQLYQNLDKLRLTLALVKCPEQQPTEANPPVAAPATRRLDLGLALKGAAHGTFGIGLIVGNWSAYAALLFTAPVADVATKVSYEIGKYACSRAYARLTEAIRL